MLNCSSNLDEDGEPGKDGTNNDQVRNNPCINRPNRLEQTPIADSQRSLATAKGILSHGAKQLPSKRVTHGTVDQNVFCGELKSRGG